MAARRALLGAAGRAAGGQRGAAGAAPGPGPAPGASAGAGASPGCAAGRSRLFEHAREGLSAPPQLDVTALSERDVERRRGPLGGAALREIVSGGNHEGGA